MKIWTRLDLGRLNSSARTLDGTKPNSRTLPTASAELSAFMVPSTIFPALSVAVYVNSGIASHSSRPCFRHKCICKVEDRRKIVRHKQYKQNPVQCNCTCECQSLHPEPRLPKSPVHVVLIVF